MVSHRLPQRNLERLPRQTWCANTSESEAAERSAEAGVTVVPPETGALRAWHANGFAKRHSKGCMKSFTKQKKEEKQLIN